MPDDLRPEVVSKLTASPPLPAELTDLILDSTDAERAAAADQLADQTLAFLEQAGKVKPSMSILDADHDQIMLVTAAYGVTMPWWNQPGWNRRNWSGILKVCPADVAA